MTNMVFGIFFQTAFLDDSLEAIYLLTDGKPDTSTALVLEHVLEMNESHHIPITTISFNCSDRYLLQFIANFHNAKSTEFNIINKQTIVMSRF